MAKAAAKKSVPKKGKYIWICSSAAHRQDKTRVGPRSHMAWVPTHGLALPGLHGASMVEVAEVETHF